MPGGPGAKVGYCIGKGERIRARTNKAEEKKEAVQKGKKGGSKEKWTQKKSIMQPHVKKF